MAGAKPFQQANPYPDQNALVQGVIQEGTEQGYSKEDIGRLAVIVLRAWRDE